MFLLKVPLDISNLNEIWVSKLISLSLKRDLLSQIILPFQNGFVNSLYSVYLSDFKVYEFN